MCVGLFLLYFAIVLVGLIPVNNDFRPTADGVEIHIISTDVHADFILPMTTDTIDWRREFPADMFRGDTSRATHVMVGWGDKGFYLETRTWADFRIATALKALLWPTDSCLHVNLTRIDRLRIKPRTVTISIEQYESLVDFIEQTFARNDEGPTNSHCRIVLRSDRCLFRSPWAIQLRQYVQCLDRSRHETGGPADSLFRAPAGVDFALPG